MSNNACNCCEQPPCAPPALEFVSATATCNNACGEGHTDGAGNTNLYATKTITAQGSLSVYKTERNDAGECVTTLTACSGTTTKKDRAITIFTAEDAQEGYSASGSESVTTIHTNNYNETTQSCETVLTRTGTSNLTVTEPEILDTEGNHIMGGTTTCSRTFDGTSWSGGDGPNGRSCLEDFFIPSIFGGSYPLWMDFEQPDLDVTYIPDPGPTPDITYSDPVGPCELTLPDFPDFDTPPGEFTKGQGNRIAASRDWTDRRYWGVDGIEKGETKVKWRIKHAPTGTCYLKIWLRKTTTITGDPTADPPTEDEVTTDDTETYEWNGTGNPCIKHPDLGVDADENHIKGGENEIDPPDENGSITVEILKYSCVKGYEPDVSDEENPQPNGYPDLTWEAAAP